MVHVTTRRWHTYVKVDKPRNRQAMAQHNFEGGTKTIPVHYLTFLTCGGTKCSMQDGFVLGSNEFNSLIMLSK